ncbi:MAG: glycosyltransferase family 2 protein, partial [Bacteroidota bacterium]
VKSWAYQKQGGMPKRKAGEDFHFINKIIPLGHFGEINSTRVIPSPRVSDRVPFGTGKAVKDWLSSQELKTYNPRIFEDLAELLSSVNDVYNKNKDARERWYSILPKSIKGYLNDISYKSQVERLNKNSTSLPTFKKHFFHWFDAFQCMKFIHYARDNFYANVPINEAAKWLLNNDSEEDTDLNNKELLTKLRSLDRKGYFIGFMKED